MSDERYLADVITRLVQKSVTGAMPYRATVDTVTTDGVKLLLPGAVTAGSEVHARLAGLPIADGDDVLVLDVQGVPFVLGRIKNAAESTPSLEANANAGSGATPTITGSDDIGEIEIVTGSTGLATGVFCTVTFANPRPDAFFAVSLTPATSATADLQGRYHITGRATTKFDIGLRVSPSATSTYRWQYQIKEYES